MRKPEKAFFSNFIFYFRSPFLFINLFGNRLKEMLYRLSLFGNILSTLTIKEKKAC